MLITAAITLFIIAALFGFFILLAILQNKPTPKPIVIIHGPLAATGLVLLIIEIAQGNTAPMLVASLVIFLLAAIGGFTLYVLDTLKKPIPKTLAIIHPLVAATALVILIIYAVQVHST